jgi:putative nucleotidyltransferase with HDIG domain
MTDTILSYLGGWWARWFGRAVERHAPAPTPVVVSQPEPVLVPQEAELVAAPEAAVATEIAVEPEAVDAASEAEIEESFREMVGGEPPSDFTKTPFIVEARVREATLAALGQLKQIPALQSLVQGVMQTMGRDGVSVDEIVEALEKDSALCVRILTMANSVAISPEQRIVDLQTAVQMLGVTRVRRVAQAVFTLRGAQRMVDGIDWRHLWIHALATAAIAEELDRRLNPEPSSQIYMAGLLHDLGKIVLSTIAAEAYRDVIVDSWNGFGRLEGLEHDRFGVTHREAGVVFATGNKLSDLVVDVIEHHGDPAGAEKHRVEVAIVSVANFMSKARGLGFSGSRLDATDGEIEHLPAWKVIAEGTGREVNVPRLELEMADFFARLRIDLRGLREAVR